MLRCIAFGPYVEGFDPDSGPHPNPQQIDTLLDVIAERTNFSCIMTCGVLNGLNYTFQAAEERGLKVIAVIWLVPEVNDASRALNDQSIATGISEAQEHNETIIRLSCGSEMRTRYGSSTDTVIRRCITALKNAGLTQPVTSIDTWGEWCGDNWNASAGCGQWDLAQQVDWIGINVFPWWVNKNSAIFTCTPAAGRGRVSH